ncbi:MULTISPECIES: AimR family lysis-lysogeny pheromone receptor [Bacillus]|uniref:AimR family lysis-lysogeny pheromone receptor n=1 Tax=Bacillus TaxID=1386 RepID=UPI001CDD679F|nr:MULTISPECIES: AimR family lysis-lysogeny pheromone receptor [Bacillus]MCY7757830.1 AimR family lysis-lysogeny pheromone receptor [Bacillus inaquosorum]MCY8174864.1 AimR family lysis-lysogeny pheromone receptor [Bacillus inaquosorum]MCY8731510.1 AimR family lysis-lysogeny pheromone receptor [Bacillus inaquosorum]
MKLKQMIKNECEKDNQLATRLAKLAGYEKVNGFYKFVNTPEKEMENIEGLINIVKSLFPDNEKQLLSEYFLELDPNKKCARHSVEYSDLNQWDELTDRLINNLCESSNSISREWGQIYSIHRRLNKSEITLNDAIRETGKFRIKTPEMFLFSNILIMYEYLKIGEFGLMKSTSQFLDIEELPDGFIKECYYGRIELLKANIFLNDYELEETRIHCQKVIESTNNNRLIVFGYLTYGNTFIFEDYEEAKLCYEKGMDYAKENPHHVYKLELALCFLNNVWAKDNKWVDFQSNEIPDMIEVAYYLVNMKEQERAASIIEKIEKLNVLDDDLGFLNHVKGLLYDDVSFFHESIKKFKKSGDKLCLNLPLIELKKRGYTDEILNLISL